MPVTVLHLVDHIIYGVPDLDRGVDEVEALLGVRPVVGGRHPAFGTHNALLSLGGATYLEVMAHDPSLAVPVRGVLFGLDRLERPRVITWVLRSEDVDERAARARAVGVPLGEVSEGGRQRPDGTVLSWRSTDPFAHPFGGAVPFLIAWGEAAHPSQSAPLAGALVRLGIEHPEPDAVVAAFRALDIDLPVRAGDQARITAEIATAAGVRRRLA